jgi:hypothetical protein
VRCSIGACTRVVLLLATLTMNSSSTRMYAVFGLLCFGFHIPCMQPMIHYIFDLHILASALRVFSFRLFDVAEALLHFRKYIRFLLQNHMLDVVKFFGRLLQAYVFSWILSTNFIKCCKHIVFLCYNHG